MARPYVGRRHTGVPVPPGVGLRPPQLRGRVHQGEVLEHESARHAVKPLLAPLPLAGRVGTADALPTQVETARSLVEDKHAHYLFTVKDNQPTLNADIAGLQMEAFPP